MSQFTSSFWDFYIGLITLVSIIGCAVFLKAQSVRRVETKEGGTATTGHVWDETLTEYHHPLPRWWSWLFYLTVLFALLYLLLYPGLGSWKGVLGWTEVGQLKAENERMDAKVGPLYAKFAAQPIPELAKNADAMATAQRLFLNHCAQCHASDGGGSRGFPNLTDNDWLWGGTPEVIQTTITDGRMGVMPPWGPVLGEQGVKDVAAYVMSLSGMPADSIRVARGKPLFATNCVACHGPEGKGNQALGAPNLTDKTWLYGAGEPVIIETITKGRNSQMPAHKNILSPEKIHLLAAYVYSLSHNQ